jgi:flap endonuclease GEN
MGGGSKFWDLFNAPREGAQPHLQDGTDVSLADTADFEGVNDSFEANADVPSMQGCGNRTDGSLGAAVNLLRETRLAVDLSQWIVEGQAASSRPGEKLYLKTIIHRVAAMCSTKSGRMRPVFVADPSKTTLRSQLQVNLRMKILEQQKEGAKHNTQAFDARRSRKFVAKCNKARQVLELMGCPTLVAEGEAEQLCAQLNRTGLVAACVSQDGDCLCFGARRVFKTFSPCEQAAGWPMEYFDADEIHARLGLGREQLVAAMLLLGCDFCDGVEHTGTAKTLRFLRDYGADVLPRLRAWARGAPAAGVHLYEDPHRDGRRQPPHCSRCGSS